MDMDCQCMWSMDRLTWRSLNTVEGNAGVMDEEIQLGWAGHFSADEKNRSLVDNRNILHIFVRESIQKRILNLANKIKKRLLQRTSANKRGFGFNGLDRKAGFAIGGWDWEARFVLKEKQQTIWMGEGLKK
jgi:hypothetical protein